jgi:hypothetical protein
LLRLLQRCELIRRRRTLQAAVWHPHQATRRLAGLRLDLIPQHLLRRQAVTDHRMLQTPIWQVIGKMDQTAQHRLTEDGARFRGQSPLTSRIRDPIFHHAVSARMFDGQQPLDRLTRVSRGSCASAARTCGQTTSLPPSSRCWTLPRGVRDPSSPNRV